MEDPIALALSRDDYAALLRARFGSFYYWLFKLTGRPRAFYTPRGRSDAPTVYYRSMTPRVAAHEYGHHLGLRHPRNPFDLVFDVSGLGLRVLDRHDLMERSHAWRSREGFV